MMDEPYGLDQAWGRVRYAHGSDSHVREKCRRDRTGVKAVGDKLASETKLSYMAGRAPSREKRLIEAVMNTPTILVIDDELIIRTNLAEFLQKVRFDVHTASTGELGLQMLARQK